MQYQSLDQIAAEADVRLAPVRQLNRRQRLTRWAEVLGQRSGRLRSIPDVEFGTAEERAARRADNSPLTVAWQDPMLRAAGLKSDTVGDAAAFFGLSEEQLHRLVCYCHHGRFIDASLASAQVRAVARVGTITPARLAAGLGAAAVLAAMLL